MAWPRESKAGRSVYGPYWPNPDTETRMIPAFSAVSRS